MVANLGLAKVPLDSDANIYESAIRALEELEIRQLADDLGIEHTPEIIQKASSVCYDELGCFDKNGTFKHLKQLSPLQEADAGLLPSFTQQGPLFAAPVRFPRNKLDLRFAVLMMHSVYEAIDNLNIVSSVGLTLPLCI